MRIRYKFRYVILALMLGAGSGCNKWLDVKPKTQVGEQDLLTTEQGFKDALIGVYTGISDQTLYGREFTMAMMDVLGANYNVGYNLHTYYQAGLYNYEDGKTKTVLDDIWKQAYKNIANINNLLEEIDARKGVFKPGMYELVKGEALGLRALLHFDMLRAFGPVPATGLDKPAIPYVTSFNMQVQPRQTARQIVALCLQDLEAARALLSWQQQVNYGHADIFLAHTRNHFNYWAATGLIARISLYAGDVANAYKYAKMVIDGGKFQLIEAGSLAGTSADRVFSREHLFAVYVSNLQDLNLKHFKVLAGTTNVLTNTATFINARFEVTSGGSTDYRYLHLWKTEGSSATKYPAKYWMEDLTGGTGYNLRRVPVLRVSEMYYIAAETAPAVAEKVGFLNKVRSHRGLQLLPTDISNELVEAEIMKEYKKEFFQEGQLFFYYKRKNAEKLEGTAKPGNDALYVLPLPDDEIEFNQN